MSYYIGGQSGDSYDGATVHRTPECSELEDTPTRPLAESTVTATKSLIFCRECAGGHDNRCTTELTSGETCGREKPCPYHD